MTAAKPRGMENRWTVCESASMFRNIVERGHAVPIIPDGR